MEKMNGKINILKKILTFILFIILILAFVSLIVNKDSKNDLVIDDDIVIDEELDEKNKGEYEMNTENRLKAELAAINTEFRQETGGQGQYKMVKAIEDAFCYYDSTLQQWTLDVATHSVSLWQTVENTNTLLAATEQYGVQAIAWVNIP